MRRALVVGGANGIGLAIAHEIASKADFDKVYIVDKNPIAEENNHNKFDFYQLDLTSEDYSIFNEFGDIDTLMITAGFGRLSLFADIEEPIIQSSFRVNAEAPIRIIKRFYDRISSSSNFYCGVMVSIAGFMSSPLFSVYAATKAALKIFIESVNVELEKNGSANRILNVSPGSIKGTSFNNDKTDLALTKNLASEILENLYSRNDLFIPQYEEVFKEVLERYHSDFRAEGRHSYDYKVMTKRFIPNVNNSKSGK